MIQYLTMIYLYHVEENYADGAKNHWNRDFYIPQNMTTQCWVWIAHLDIKCSSF